MKLINLHNARFDVLGNTHEQCHSIHEDGHLIDGKSVASGTTHLQKGTGLDSYTIRYKGELP